MGQSLRHSLAFEDKELERLRVSDKQLAERVDATLKREFERAKGILESQRWLLDLVTDELVRHGRLTPEKLNELSAVPRETALAGYGH